VLVSELAGRSAELREIAAGIGQESRVDLQRPLDTFARSPGFLDALAEFVGSLSADAEDDSTTTSRTKKAKSRIRARSSGAARSLTFSGELCARVPLDRPLGALRR
jgi:hypothetical protein